MKLLIVDDQHSVHLYLQKALDLTALGFDEILHAENGLEALDMVRTHRPEVMLLDIQMPGMNGIALLETMQKERMERPETIVLSAYDEFLYAKRCIDFGVRRYVLKPIDPQELTGLLGEACQAVLMRRLDSYRWAFPLFCAHLNDGFDLGTLPVSRMDPLPYRVICLNSRDDRNPAIAALEPVSRSTLNGLTWLLLSMPSAKAWEDVVTALSTAEGLAAGVSDLRQIPADMAAAAREARKRLWQSFYACGVHTCEGAPCSDKVQDGLRAIGDCFLQEDSVRLAEMTERAFARFARDRASPEFVLDACRRLLARLRIDHCGERAPNLNDWPGFEGFFTANQLQEALIGELFTLRGQNDPAAVHSDAEIIGRIRSYVDEHYSEDLSLSAIAAKFYISRYQVSRLFKQAFGVNYQDYVLSVRMKAAAHLLANTNVRLYEISGAVGFDEPSYFSNVFKKTYGLSPRAYRLAEKENHHD